MYLSHVRWKLIEGAWNTCDIFTEQDQTSSAPKKPRQTLLSTFFKKVNMKLKQQRSLVTRQNETGGERPLPASDKFPITHALAFP